MDFSVKLYLVRHGETAWSLTGQHTSRTDLPLTPQGEDAARSLGEKLRPVAFDRVFSSPRLRALQTCERACPNVERTIEPDLTEWDYGDYEGLRTVEIHEMHPGWNLFEHGCPGGESPAQVGERVDRLLARLRTLDGDIALFSHGHFLRVLAVRWIGLPVEQGQHFLLGTASLSVLAHERGRTAIALWNERAVL